MNRVAQLKIKTATWPTAEPPPGNVTSVKEFGQDGSDGERGG